MARLSFIPQSHGDCKRFLNGKGYRRIGHNTSVEELHGDRYGVRLHSTFVVVFEPDGKVTLNSAGWKTVTTQDRINQIIRPMGFVISQKNYEWRLLPWGGSELGWDHVDYIPFEDGMSLPSLPTTTV